MNAFDTPPASLSGEAKRALLARLLEERAARPQRHPLSFAQQRLWFLDRLAPDTDAYHVWCVIRLQGALDLPALQASLRELARRHATLRTSFPVVDGEPVQLVAAAAHPSLAIVALEGLPAEHRLREGRRVALAAAQRPFDLSRGPLLHASLLRVEEEESFAVLVLHHIVSDTWSIHILVRELAALYDAFSAGEPSPLPELPLQYVDFVRWQRRRLQGEVLERHLAYWKRQLADVPALDMPTDRPRPPVPSHLGASRWFLLPDDLVAHLQALAQREGTTQFMILLAALESLFHRYTGQVDFCIGSPIASRNRKDLEALIGFFVNTLVLRARLDGRLGFRDLLDRVRETALEAYAHQELPFEKLVEELNPQRDLSRSVFFQVAFAFQTLPPTALWSWDEDGVDELPAEERLRLQRERVKFELTFEVGEGPRGIGGVLEYNRDLFDAATMQRLLEHYVNLLEAAAAAPATPIGELPLTSPAERRQLLCEWNDSAAAGCTGRGLHEWIEEQVRRTPAAVAVTCGEGSLSYLELNREANRWARRLRAAGVGPEARVAVCLERSLDLLVGLLAVLKAGGAYVPIDPEYPAERTGFMLRDSGATVLLSQERLLAKLGPHAVAAVCLDRDRAATATASGEDLEPRTAAENLAYVLYTSGSTGRPKGVQISHGSLTNLLSAMRERPGFGSGDTIVGLTSISFDIAALELYLPLLTGGRVVIASREEAVDGRRLQALIADSGASVVQATPATWRLLLEMGWPGDPRLEALCGGEALPPSLAADLLPRVGSLWNVYGPTETTVWSTVEPLRSATAISIGRPIANTEAYVLDAQGGVVPLGSVGELCLGGAGLARGYLGRPELTAERFVPDPFAAAGARLYRTGDLVRLRRDGRLEHAGRIDHQVKVRGFRIELGEIEATLCRHLQVAAAVVVAREESAGDRRLVAYVVPRQPGWELADELRAWVRESLPEHMVPAAWVQLAALPLTPNGKVDRRALPAPAAQPRAWMAPRTPTEEVLAGLWGRVLRAEQVGAEDSFFDLGGHSLLATQLVARVREAFGVELPLRRVFEAPVLAAQARAIEAARGQASAAPPLARMPRPDDLPLSFAQQRLWFLTQLDRDNPAYNMSVALRLVGDLDPAALAAGLDAIIDRHEVLRTTFAGAGREPVQRLHPRGLGGLALADLSGLSGPVRAGLAQALALEDLRRPFDLESGPLLRATLLRLEEREHVILFSMHHIVSDAWSLGVLVREMGALYRAFALGAPASLPPLAVQYADYALWQRSWLRGAVLAEHVAYWRERLAGAPALLELPTDRPRPAVQRFRGARVDAPLPAELGASCRAVGQRQGATLFMVLLALFAVLLRRHTGDDDLVIGTPTANRDRAELEALIGFFVNTLALRVDLGGDPTFEDLLVRVRAMALGAYAHQDLPFEKLVEELQPQRSLSHSPLFQVMLALQNAPATALELPGLTLKAEARPHEVSKFDLTVTVDETAHGLLSRWHYDRELFDRVTVERLARRLSVLAAGAVAAPRLRLSELPLLPPAERLQLVGEWSRSEPVGESGPRGLHEGLHEMVQAQADRRPDAPAVVLADVAVTYAELNRRANRLARRLARLGVGPEVPVGLCAEPSPAMVVGLLAVLKAGGAYVPLDPAYPQERLAFLLDDAEVPVLLTLERLLPSLPTSAAQIVLLDADPEESSENLPPLAGPESLAYVIYTSGSTGSPKGVLVPHRGLGNLAQAQTRAFEVGAESRVLQFASLGFDASVSEIAMAFRAGAALCLASRRDLLPGPELSELLERAGITTVTLPPAALAVLPEERLAGLRTLAVAGEACPLDLARRWRQGRRLINAYGPTEATVCATMGVYDGGDRLPVGRPMQGMEAYVLDAAGELAPAGAVGELWVGGIGLARGYRRQPDLTAERFVPHPYSATPGARLYRTGDRVRFLADGALEFLGRLDHQVKIRGVRVEPGEVEAALRARPGVREAVAVARQDGGGPARLVAYVVPAAGSALDPTALRTALAGSLPEPLVPAAVVVLAALPIGPNGKLDRRALPAPEGERPGGRELVAPRTELERFLAGLWREILAVETLGVHDDFFALGGNSITGALFVNRLQRELGEIVHVVVMFDAPTVAQLASWVAANYPEAVAHLFGPGVLGDGREAVATGRVDAARAAAFRTLIPPAPTLPTGGAKNPPAVFVLSPPRSGSTLLRVMLGGHPRLFAPPELELLGFATLAERRAAFPGRNSFWLEGVTRALMEVRGCAAEEAEGILAELERQGGTTRELYRRLQEWIGDRTLVDKTPSYALDPAVLRRAEEAFSGARYLHLLRHPYGMIRSFEEAKLDQVFFRHPHSFSRRELAELIWLVSQENIREFLAGVPAERQMQVRFEELLAAPEAVLRRVCDFLELAYHADMAAPYKQGSARMTDGIHAWSRMLGDVKFHQHAGVDGAPAERWREQLNEDFLGDATWEMAGRLGYPVERAEIWMPSAPAAIEPGEPWPLSFAQERLWVLDRMDPGSPAYNIFTAVRLAGPLDVDALARSLSEIARRHAVLRAVFTLLDGEPRQIVTAPAAVPLPRLDLRGLPPAARESEARRLARQLGRQPFDLERGPLLRAALLQLGEADHAALFSMHHIASDGWSMGVLIREVSALYAAFRAGRPSPLPELACQYLDFARWQRGFLTGRRLEEQLAYWRDALAGLAPLQLPTDRPRPPLQTFRGATRGFAVPGPRSESLRALAQRQGGTQFMVLLAAFAALLYRCSGQEDLAVGTPTANRDRAEVEGLIGFFVNTLALRVDLAQSPSFEQLLSRVRRVALAGFAHQSVPFEKVVFELQPQRDLSISPLFQVMLAYQNVPAETLTLPDLALRPFGAEIGTAKLELTLNVVEGPAGFAGSLEYRTDLFDGATIERLLSHFQRLLAAVAAAPATPIADLPLLSTAERHQIASEWSDAATAYPGPARLHERLALRSAQVAGEVAVTFEEWHLTYGALERAANRLAWYLIGRGVGRGSLVGLCLERSLSLPVALLGILKAGAAYVPMDPSYPEERLAYMLEDAGLALLLVGATAPEGLCRRAAESLPVVRLGAAAAEIEREADGDPRVAGEAADLAYVLYTSGSTGRPKGVEISHGALINFLESMRERPGLAPEDVLLAVTSLSFDIAGLELYLPLLAGARVDLASRETAEDGVRLLARLRRSGATVVQATPATWRLLLAAGWAGEPPLRVLCGGEALPADLAAELRARSSVVWNLYGPTETTIWSSACRVGEGGVVIGRPIANTRIVLLDRHGAPVPPGVPGELFIGGAGLARGYRRRPDLTGERFVPNPFGSLDGAGSRLYRTGDLVRYRTDGTIEFLGRLDHQVKVRGFRIELGEIEATILQSPEVGQAVVTARSQHEGDSRLAAFVVPREPAGDPLDTAELRGFLRDRLPEHMVPGTFVVLPALPLTPNGKVDRKALAGLAGAEPKAAAYEPPASGLEQIIAELWGELLERERIGRYDNFFDLGGHSLLMARVQSQLAHRLARPLGMVELFSHPTVASLAQFLSRGENAQAVGGQVETQAKRAKQGQVRLERLRQGRGAVHV